MNAPLSIDAFLCDLNRLLASAPADVFDRLLGFGWCDVIIHMSQTPDIAAPEHLRTPEVTK